MLQSKVKPKFHITNRLGNSYE